MYPSPYSRRKMLCCDPLQGCTPLDSTEPDLKTIKVHFSYKVFINLY